MEKKDKMKYSRAIKRLDEIIAKIENEEIDVDDLAEQVKEAVGLINLCKEKIQQAQLKVHQVVEDFDAEQTDAS